MIIAYRGSSYHGWQHQEVPPNWKGDRPPAGQGLPTIQETLNRTMREVIGEPITVVGSSRTDAGVHAKGQVAHFDTDRLTFPPDGMRRAINYQLPDDILVRSIEPAPRVFDAIRATVAKRYQYFIWNAEDRAVFFPELAWHRRQKLDVAAMREAAAHFVGTHDFASFCRPGHGRETTERNVTACDISYRAPRLVISVEGRGFLWHMVRIMVGTLVDVAIGTYRPDDIPRMLDARQRKAAGQTAPPQGLYLQWVKCRDVSGNDDARNPIDESMTNDESGNDE